MITMPRLAGSRGIGKAIALAVILVLCWIYLPSITRYRELKSEEDPEWEPRTIEALRMIPNYYLQYFYHTDKKLKEQESWPPSRAAAGTGRAPRTPRPPPR